MRIRAATLLNAVEQNWLVERIREAEQTTSGELRVHLEDSTPKNSFDRAAEVFAALNMHDTRYRNGVLIYIEVVHHNFVIIGDMAFNSKVDDAYWNKLAKKLGNSFHQEHYYEGLAMVVNDIGDMLKKNFPIGDDENPNELSDSISFG